MKTPMIIILSVILTACGSLRSTASNPGNAEKINRIISKAVEYPDFARAKHLSGFVLTALSVSDDGTIMIHASNSDNPELQQYVTEALSELNLKGSGVQTGMVFYYRFNFRMC